MALGTNHIIASEVAVGFIPELWSDEVIASYKSNLVLANLVRKLNHRGKKGATIHVPAPQRGSVSAKAAEAQVTLIQHGTDTVIDITINKHVEYSRFIEDFADVQALESLRRFYTDDGGYAVARDVDLSLILEMGDSSSGTWSANYTAATNTIEDAAVWPSTAITGDGTAVTSATAIAAILPIADAGVRAANRLLDIQDVPMAGRSFVVRPETKEDLLGLSRFTEQAFVGDVGAGNSIRNGLVGDIYGNEVYVTNQLPLLDAAGTASDADANFLFHSDATVLVEQLGMRSQTQYKQEYLADLFTVDMIYGVKNLRDGSIVPIITK